MAEVKTNEVVAAIFIEDSKIFVAQRGYGKYKGYWEFPGGKVEPGETHQQALMREIKEEMSCDVSVGDLVVSTTHEYPEMTVNLYCYKCEMLNGNLSLNEHMDAKWLDGANLASVDWLPADIELIKELRNYIKDVDKEL